ncbi:MAG: heme-binding protein [Flavobacteriaceae bacterium]|nr:heme-binding protein [Flavobacteriaceae bacterium]
MNITLKQAQDVILAAKEKAIALNTKMNITVVDSGANLVAFARMDEAVLGAIDISLKKAKTAILFKKDTEVLGQLSQPGSALFNIEHSNGGLITFAGGMPIHNLKGNIIGAIGISGSSVANDKAVAGAGILAIKAP